MKKFALLALLSVLVAMPVYAYSPPNQGTDNATDIILWQGDTANVSITAANLTVKGDGYFLLTGELEIAHLQDAIVAGADEIADQLGILSVTWMLFLFLFGLAVLAYIGKDRGLFLIAGLGFLVQGFTFISTSITACILMVLAGIFVVLRAFSSKGRE